MTAVRRGLALARTATVCAALGGLAVPAGAQLTGNPQSPVVDMWRVVIGTGAVALIAVAALLVLRRAGFSALRRGPADAQAALRVVSRLQFDARNGVALVEAGAERWLIGIGPGGPSLLSAVAANTTAARGESEVAG
jgi:flagellar biogenesis protein FliO